MDNWRSGVVLAVLLVDAVLLAGVELLFLPQRWFGTQFPVVAVLAAVTTPWLVKRADELRWNGSGGNGLVPAAPLVVWTAAILVLGAAGPGGDVLLPSDWRSVLLVACGMFPAAVTLGRALARPLAAGRRAEQPDSGPLVGKGKHRG